VNEKEIVMKKIVAVTACSMDVEEQKAAGTSQYQGRS
jgi:hypothetical protein